MTTTPITINTQTFNKFPKLTNNKKQSAVDVHANKSEATNITISNHSYSFLSLDVTAKTILSRINEQLGLPTDQIETFQNLTPEKTGKNIADGIKALYATYQQQVGTDLSKEKVEDFFKKINTGINKGYDAARQTLETIGANEIPQVTKDIEEARLVLDREILAFKEEVMKNLPTSSTETPT
jgi:hypothetical protein